MKPTLILVAAFFPLSLLHSADLKLAGVFTDHTVLQRDQAVPIWGWANPGENVSVEFGGQKKTGTADESGKWMVRLDSMKASNEGRELSVRSSMEGRQSKIHDVLVGDVWLCSGQSNMHFRLKSAANAKQEIATANHAEIRFFNVPHQFGQKPLKDMIGEWQVVSPATAGECSAVAYYFAKALQQHVGVPMGLLNSSVGGTRIESWMRAETLSGTGQSAALVKRWNEVSAEEFEKIAIAYREFQRVRDKVHPQAVQAAKEKGEPLPPAPVMPKMRCHDCPSALHNGMIEPLEPFALRGAIWYQGESNAGNPSSYEITLPAMIADWRKVWGSKLPFLFVQIAPHRSIHPAFREAQARIWQQTPHTGMAVTTDVGDAQNIHPLRKGPVGERLALAARAVSYGEQLVSSGPVFEEMKIDGARAVISFGHLGGGLLMKGKVLKGFTIAGGNRKFVPAEAVIEGNTVVASAAGIEKPVAVRYGWAQVPDVNLYNREGLPAVPFSAGVSSLKATGKK